MRRPYQLPNLNNLVAFEAVARTQSFTEAGAELNVTKGAVSHRIKALEVELTSPLFDRHRSGAQLTAAGQSLFKVVRQGFSSLSDEITRIKLAGDKNTVTIQSSLAISTLWLTPRVSQYWSVNTQISFDQIVTDSPVISPNADIILAYADPDQYPTWHKRVVLQDRLLAVGSPDLKSKNQVETLDQLASLPLIHMRAENNRWTSWNQWFDLAGCPQPPLSGLSVNNHIVALQLAQQGMGAALAWEALAKGSLGRGELIELVDFDPVPSPMPMVALVKQATNNSVTSLLDWLIG